MIEWQPIETAPKDGALIDVWVESCYGGEARAYRQINVDWGEYQRTSFRSGGGGGVGWRYWLEGVPVGIEANGEDLEFGDPWFFRVTHWYPAPAAPHGH